MGESVKTRLLRANDVRQIAHDVGIDALMDEVIQALSADFGQSVATDQFSVPPRDGFSYEGETTGLVEWMPVLKAGSHVAVKLVGYHPENPRRHGLPTVLSTLLKFDTTSGHLETIADGTLATAIRTGAASAVASQVLAKSNSEQLGLIGAGAQSVTQLHAITRCFPIREVLVFDVDDANSRSFADRASRLNLNGVNIRICPLQDVVSNADILCTVTSVEVGRGPVMQDDQLRSWLHINAVGSDFPGKTELPLSVLEKSFVCPDFPLQAVKEGECQQLAPDDIGASLPEVITDQESFAKYRDQLTVFDSTGFALEDYSVLRVLEAHAQRLQLGEAVELESHLDPHDPYEGVNSVVPTAARLLRQG